MTDNAPQVIDTYDEGIVTVFTASGSVGIRPNRPVCITGNMRVQQIVTVANEYIGVALASGTEGEKISVRMRGVVKAYITGTNVEPGTFLIATGSSTSACFSGAATTAGVSGSTYVTYPRGNVKTAAIALQTAGNGDTILVQLV